MVALFIFRQFNIGQMKRRRYKDDKNEMFKFDNKWHFVYFYMLIIIGGVYKIGGMWKKRNGLWRFQIFEIWKWH